MNRKEDRETRYYVDVDIIERKIIGWDYGRRDRLTQTLDNPAHHRVFLTRGQYNKLVNKIMS